ncbi:MAG TPA: M1 family aminopeptidase [Chloroflexia bacterium]|nr:M1 family aminopeptidase [Chloroflexia bacterium]
MRRRALRCLLCTPVLLAGLLAPLAPAPQVGAAPATAPLDHFADPAIATIWRRDDGALAAGQGSRAWVWGPGPFYTTYEPMDGTPTGIHLVQYFDKGRLEVNDPGADRKSPWFVTSGLLVKELVDGAIRTGTGPGATEARAPAGVPVAGDAGLGAAPSYANCRAAVTAPSPGDQTGRPADAALAADGTLSHLAAPPAPVTLGPYYSPGGHNLAAVFWRYIQAGGTGPAAGWVYTLGLPISEPFWVRARVGGTPRDVLVQLFERRTLTYTPSNDAPWQVEMGNVGRAYYDWRYADIRPDTKTAATRTRYTVDAAIAANRDVQVSESIRYVNSTVAAVPLQELVLRTVYHHWSGAFIVGAATAGGRPTTTRWRDEVNLAIALPAPLAPGAAVEVTLTYRIHPPRFGGRHGYDATNDLLTLGDWLPSVVPYENGGWSQFPYADHGDNGNNAVADYTVHFSSATRLIVGGTGTATEHNGTRWTFAAPGVRDVAYTISPRLLDPYMDASLTRDAGGVRVVGNFLPAHRAAGGALLDTVAAALRWYSTAVGPYPYPVFTVGEMALPGEAQWDYAQEYPMLYLVQTNDAGRTPAPDTWSWYTPLHETAHAWFYSAVGNNQLTDPWLDEAMATYLSLEYIRAQRPGLYPAAFAAMSGPGGGWPVSAGLYSGFPTDAAYSHAVYDQGAVFIDAVRTAMGPDRFRAALRAYYDAYGGGRARPRDLLAAWQHASPVDLSPIFQRYLAAW